MAMHEIDLGGAERKLFCDCVDDIRMGGKPEKLKKVGNITVYRRDESEKGKE